VLDSSLFVEELNDSRDASAATGTRSALTSHLSNRTRAVPHRLADSAIINALAVTNEHGNYSGKNSWRRSPGLTPTLYHNENDYQQHFFRANW